MVDKSIPEQKGCFELISFEKRDRFIGKNNFQQVGHAVTQLKANQQQHQYIKPVD
jgi:hypothetical protein